MVKLVPGPRLQDCIVGIQRRNSAVQLSEKAEAKFALSPAGPF